MAPNVIEKYQQILAADPRSRIFVELARALVERGDGERAVEVCRAGLEHHPKSILGRVTWGRALLLLGDTRGALDQFDVAIGIDPANPYGYNLVGEALLARQLHREALPVLTRALELQPADARLRALLEEARQRARGGSSPAIPAIPGPPPASGSAPLSGAPPPAGASGAAERPPAPAPPPATADRSGRDAPPGDEAAPTHRDLEAVAPGETSDYDPTVRVSLEELPGEDAPPGPSETPLGPLPTLSPPPRPPPPVRRGPPGPRTLLAIIPPGGAPAAPAVPVNTPDPDEAERLATTFEHELRAKAEAAEALAAQPSRRGRIALLVSLGLVVAGAAGTFAWFNARASAEELERALKEARVGLARDTRGSLGDAAKVLAAARARTPGDMRLLSLVAQVDGVLAAEHGDAGARTLAGELTDPAVAGDGALAARWLLASSPADKAEAAKALLAPAPGARPEPLLLRLAGELLVKRGELDTGRERLKQAAEATPPQLGALASLGDSYLEANDAERALPYFEAAIGAHATHPRSVVGAAEARLALARPVDGSLKELQAVEADPGSAPPLQVRLRYELAFARVLAETGRPADGARRLKLAAGALGDSAGLELVLADVLLDARSWGDAEAAAAKAIRLDARSAEARVLLARARIGQQRWLPALQAIDGVDTRNAWLQRGVALQGLGRYDASRAALEKTRREGRMTTEAAIWYARADVKLGHAERSIPLLQKLAAGKSGGALANVALGEALLAARRPAEAVAPLEQALALDPGNPEATRLLAAAKAPAPAKPAAKRPPPPAPKKKK